MKVIIRLECEEKPTVNDVLDYINELGEDLQFEIKGEDDE
jgi:ribosomal protein S10